MNTRLSWNRAEARLREHKMLEYTVTTATDLAALLGRTARGPWAVRQAGDTAVVRVEDPEDIRLIRKLFRPQDLGKREMNPQDWSARTMASSVAF